MAHRLVFECEPSSSWATTLAREYEEGDREALVQIDTSAIHGGLKLATAAGGTFGLGWVIRWLQNRGAAKVAAAGQQEHNVRLQQQADARDAEAEAEAAEAKAEEEKQQAYFATLPPDRQEHYLGVTRKGGFIKEPELLERMAALAAWNDREEKT